MSSIDASFNRMSVRKGLSSICFRRKVKAWFWWNFKILQRNNLHLHWHINEIYTMRLYWENLCRWATTNWQPQISIRVRKISSRSNEGNNNEITFSMEKWKYKITRWTCKNLGPKWQYTAHFTLMDCLQCTAAHIDWPISWFGCMCYTFNQNIVNIEIFHHRKYRCVYLRRLVVQWFFFRPLSFHANEVHWLYEINANNVGMMAYSKLSTKIQMNPAIWIAT